MRLLAVDPGSSHSAYVLYAAGYPVDFGKVSNDELLAKLRSRALYRDGNLESADHLAIEMIASYGMPVGTEVFDTCVWIGRYIEAWSGPHTRVYRKDVKLHLCGQPRAKDGNIRQALIDLYGGKDKAIGKKSTPGPLYGISADVWAALAVAVTHSATRATTSATGAMP